MVESTGGDAKLTCRPKGALALISLKSRDNPPVSLATPPNLDPKSSGKVDLPADELAPVAVCTSCWVLIWRKGFVDIRFSKPSPCTLR